MSANETPGLSKLRVSRTESFRISGDTIKILVGPDQQVFNVHESLLIKSPFFEAALKGPWKESLARQVEMPEEDPMSLQIYLHWLYSGKLPSKPQPGEKDTEFLDLVQAYVLGDKILNVAFQNIVMGGIIEKCHIGTGTVPAEIPEFTRYPVQVGDETPRPAQQAKGLLESDIIGLVFSNTNPVSPLRNLLVDLFMFHGTKNLLGKLLATGNIPQSFSESLAMELMGLEEIPIRPLKSDKYFVGQRANEKEIDPSTVAQRRRITREVLENPGPLGSEHFRRGEQLRLGRRY